MFSAAERDSAYVIDGLMRNDVVKSDIHSTDTHGYSEAIFAVTRAVAVGDPQGFSQAEREEQEIAESCNRLIKNCIICWNYLYLADRLAKMTHKNDRKFIGGNKGLQN